MAQFRTTADIVDSVLSRSGEVTNGNSAFESRALEFINRIHRSIVAGGHEIEIEINESWTWARSREPMVIELVPKYNTGTITVTNGSEAGTFSSAPTESLRGWFLKVEGRDGMFKIAAHTASATAFEIDGAYDGSSGAGLNFRAFKLDYELVPAFITIDSESNRIEFKKTSVGSILTASLTEGVYAPSDLATHVATQMTTAAAAGPTIAGSYSSVTKKFTFTSDGGGSSTLIPQFASGTNAYRSAHKKLGFDDEDLTAALTQTSTYILGGIARLIEPFNMHKGTFQYFATPQGSVYGLDENRFKRDYPLNDIQEGFPTKFCKIQERNDGTFWVRFNHYPSEDTRIEINYVPVPRDLKDNAASFPLIPRKDIDVLEYAATSELLFEKEDTKADGFLGKAKAKLQAMMIRNRTELQHIGREFGQVIAREDNLSKYRRRLIYGVPEDN